MLELATAADREAVNTIAKQIHDMHVSWRPDIYKPVEEHYTPSRFDESIRSRQLYVAKLAGEVVGFAALNQCTYDWPGVVKRKVIIVDEFGVHEFSFSSEGATLFCFSSSSIYA